MLELTILFVMFLILQIGAILFPVPKEKDKK
jgi:hypothetical protein